MRITDMNALSGFARSTAESASDFATLVYNLVLDIRDSYWPGVHCMRGPGPKWRAKSIRRVVWPRRCLFKLKNVRTRQGRPEK